MEADCFQAQMSSSSPKHTSKCLEFIVWESLTDQPSFHKFQLMFSQVKMRQRNNLVPVDNLTGIMHLLMAINWEQAYIITLPVPAHSVKGRIKVSRNLIFWECCLKLEWDNGYKIPLKVVQSCCCVMHFRWCWKGAGGSLYYPRAQDLWVSEPTSYQRWCRLLWPPASSNWMAHPSFFTAKRLK